MVAFVAQVLPICSKIISDLIVFSSLTVAIASIIVQSALNLLLYYCVLTYSPHIFDIIDILLDIEFAISDLGAYFVDLLS